MDLFLSSRWNPCPVSFQRLSGPVIGGLCCLGLILFAIASTIVLSLIPIYIERSNTVPTGQTESVALPIASGQQLENGELNDAQRQTLQGYVSFLGKNSFFIVIFLFQVQSSLRSEPGAAGATVQVNSATASSAVSANCCPLTTPRDN